MKGILSLLAALLLVGCGRTVALVKLEENLYQVRARELQADVKKSLEGEQWQVTGGATTVATKRGDGRLSITLILAFDDKGNRSGFSLQVKSKHSMDFLVLGKFGHDGLAAAKAAAQSWYDAFRKSHAADLVNPGGS